MGWWSGSPTPSAAKGPSLRGGPSRWGSWGSRQVPPQQMKALVSRSRKHPSFPPHPQVPYPWLSWSEGPSGRKVSPPAPCTETTRARTPLAQQPAAPHTSAPVAPYPTPPPIPAASPLARPFSPGLSAPAPTAPQAYPTAAAASLLSSRPPPAPHPRQGWAWAPPPSFPNLSLRCQPAHLPGPPPPPTPH